MDCSLCWPSFSLALPRLNVPQGPIPRHRHRSRLWADDNRTKDTLLNAATLSSQRWLSPDGPGWGWTCRTQHRSRYPFAGRAMNGKIINAHSPSSPRKEVPLRVSGPTRIWARPPLPPPGVRS
ncbi:hypothetical protein LY78DRAFT_317251 [Colletotrichum sublineola]|nr:hypothetical protein LY78DRAFT_317251 [Colletotrichum sublineola]